MSRVIAKEEHAMAGRLSGHFRRLQVETDTCRFDEQAVSHVTSQCELHDRRRYRSRSCRNNLATSTLTHDDDHTAS